MAPKGIPMRVLNKRAVPDTRSDSITISNNAGSRVTIRRKASEIPLMISSMVAS
jgi:hypothetical protein